MDEPGAPPKILELERMPKVGREIIISTEIGVVKKRRKKKPGDKTFSSSIREISDIPRGVEECQWCGSHETESEFYRAVNFQHLKLACDQLVKQFPLAAFY